MIPHAKMIEKMNQINYGLQKQHERRAYGYKKNYEH